MDHDVPILYDVRAVQTLGKDALTPFGPWSDFAESSIKQKKICEVNKVKLHAMIQALESKLSNAQHRVKQLQLTRNTADQLATRVVESEKDLGTSQEIVPYLEDIVAEQSSQLLGYEVEVPSKCEGIWKLEN